MILNKTNTMPDISDKTTFITSKISEFILPVEVALICVGFFLSILSYPITLEGRRSTTDEFATIPFHLVLFSAALVELAKSIPVHSLILSSHLSSSVYLFIFFLSLCPVGLSLLNQKTLRHGQTILAFVS